MQTIASLVARGWTKSGIARALGKTYPTINRWDGRETREQALALHALAITENPYTFDKMNVPEDVQRRRWNTSPWEPQPLTFCAHCGRRQ